jgi:hypothetical protein
MDSKITLTNEQVEIIAGSIQKGVELGIRNALEDFVSSASWIGTPASNMKYDILNAIKEELSKVREV